MKIYRANFLDVCMTTGSGVVELPEALELMPPNGTSVTGWNHVDGRLKAEPARDYMPSSIIAGVCSSRLKHFLAARCPVPDYVQWLPLTVVAASGNIECYVMHFAGAFDVLDRERTAFIGTGYPRKPVFKPEIIARFPYFARDGFASLEFFVRDDLRHELRKAKFSGFAFDEVSQGDFGAPQKPA
jgi:hypothetical protein